MNLVPLKSKVTGTEGSRRKEQEQGSERKPGVDSGKAMWTV